MIKLIFALGICASFILANIFATKVDALIKEHEYVTKIQFPPDLYKYITRTFIMVMIGSIGFSIFLFFLEF